MSDASEPAEATEPPVEREQSPAADTRLPAADRTAEYLQWGALAVLVLFALVAAVSFYTSVGRIIDIWVAREFQPVFYAAFNFLVLLLAAVGISVLLRRLQ